LKNSDSEYKRLKGSIFELGKSSLTTDALKKNPYVKSAGDKGLQSVLADLNKELLTILKNTSAGLDGIDKNDLLNAESHTNWKSRAAIVSVMDPYGNLVGRSNSAGRFETLNADGTIKHAFTDEARFKAALVTEHEKIVTRKEEPITAFTPSQEKSWDAIHGTTKPEWFTVLPNWEQEYLIDKTKKWHDTVVNRKNLGDVLGVPPSTIRKYPGAPNGYVTSVTMSDQNADKILFEKVRSGALVPFDIEDETQKVEITTQNLEQLVANTVQRKINEAKELGKTTVNIPMAIQTLFSRPMQPEGGDDALIAAVQKVKQDLDSGRDDYLKSLGVQVPTGLVVKCDTSYTNIPVNKARGLSRFRTEWTNGVNGSAQSLLAGHAASDSKLAKAVKERLEGHNWSESMFLTAVPRRTNAMSEKAALEQILNFSKGGNRIGSCVSGKDRKEMVTEMAIAMVMYRDLYGELPPPPGDTSTLNGGTPKREAFNDLVAKQFLANHGQQIAAANSNGANGLKNVDEVYGTDICDAIKQLKGRYPQFKDQEDPIKDTKNQAGLNKPKKPAWYKSFGAKVAVGVLAIVTVIPVVVAVAVVGVAVIALPVMAAIDHVSARLENSKVRSEVGIKTKGIVQVAEEHSLPDRVMSAPAFKSKFDGDRLKDLENKFTALRADVNDLKSSVRKGSPISVTELSEEKLMTPSHERFKAHEQFKALREKDVSAPAVIQKSSAPAVIKPRNPP
jgi:hypothetical protein